MKTDADTDAARNSRAAIPFGFQITSLESEASSTDPTSVVATPPSLPFVMLATKAITLRTGLLV
jgi:hypothetical protein